ncbi:uncharacterized protein HaLaN_31150, partial [Haematococcus lacustris]
MSCNQTGCKIAVVKATDSVPSAHFSSAFCDTQIAIYLLSSPFESIAAPPPTPSQPRSGTMRTCQLLLVLFFYLSSLTQATLHDRARGLRSQGVSEEDIARYKHHHSSNAGIHRQRPEYKEALKDHPEVNRFMEWRKLHQVCQQA